MRTFTAYIEYMLMTRHYCYVPGRGAFMMVEEGANIEKAPHIGDNSRRITEIQAPHRIVRFSPLHTHDDGMLANLLMEAEGMTYDEATRYIERQAPLLSENFVQKASFDTDTDNFGFENLDLETWADIETRILAVDTSVANNEEQKFLVSSDTIAIPKYWVKRAAVMFLIALFFFTDFIGLNQGNSQLASLINVNSLQRNVVLSSHTPVQNEMILIDEVADTSLCIYASEVINSSDINTEETIHPISSLRSNITEYYIVVECTKSADLAEKACKRYKRYGYEQTSIMVTPTGTCRLYIEHYTNRRDAANRLRELRRTDERLGSAWLLPLEGTSLSSNIKKQYNDNQLSLELSHPNTRTERDQG